MKSTPESSVGQQSRQSERKAISEKGQSQDKQHPMRTNWNLNLFLNTCNSTIPGDLPKEARVRGHVAVHSPSPELYEIEGGG